MDEISTILTALFAAAPPTLMALAAYKKGNDNAESLTEVRIATIEVQRVADAVAAKIDALLDEQEVERAKAQAERDKMGLAWMADFRAGLTDDIVTNLKAEIVVNLAEIRDLKAEIKGLLQTADAVAAKAESLKLE